jgi:hypothetical protein
VAKVGQAVDRRAAVVHRELTRDTRGDLEQFGLGGVVQLQDRHQARLTAWVCRRHRYLRTENR